MREAYAKGGVAVTTTFRNLKEAIGYSHGDFVFRPVLYYENGMRNLPDSSLRKGDICPRFLQPLAFEGEKEVRLICKIPHGEPGRILPLKVPFHQWVNWIIIYPYPELRMFEEARSMLEKNRGEGVWKSSDR